MSIIKEKKLLELHPDSIECARKSCNLEDPKRMEEAIDILEEWIHKQNHFVKKDFPRIYLETNLISNKGSIERTKSKIEKLCTLRTLLPQFYKYTDIKEDFKGLFSCAIVTPLPKLTENHYRIISINPHNNEYFHSTPFIDYYILLMMYCDYFKLHDYPSGNIIIFDYRDANIMDIISKLNVLEMKQFVTLALDGYGMKVKGIYFITPSKAIDMVIKIIKPLIPVKIAERIQVHKTLESLHKVFPKNVLPIELGGSERSLKELQRDWIEELSSEEAMEFFNWIRQTRVNESCRIDEQYSEYAGLSGTFRTLSVD